MGSKSGARWAVSTARRERKKVRLTRLADDIFGFADALHHVREQAERQAQRIEGLCFGLPAAAAGVRAI